MSTKNVNVNVASTPSLLTVLFVGLKLTGHIDWSWWWVLAPTWLPLAVGGGIALVGLTIAILATVFK